MKCLDTTLDVAFESLSRSQQYPVSYPSIYSLLITMHSKQGQGKAHRQNCTNRFFGLSQDKSSTK